MIILCVVMMWLDKGRKLPFELREAVFTTVFPVIWTVEAPKKIKEFAARKLADPEAMRQKNRKLKQTVRELKRKIQRLSLYETEIKKYKKLLSASREIRETVRMTEIYQMILDPDKRIIRVAMGWKDCVYEDQALIDAYGVMGQVIDVSRLTATVRLITDQNHVMPVQFKDSGLITIAYGTGENLLRIPNLPTSAEVTVGQEIITSGLGRVYPYGYNVGKVVDVKTSTGRKYKIALVKPSAQLDRTREALLVWTDDPLKRRRILRKKWGFDIKCP